MLKRSNSILLILALSVLLVLSACGQSATSSTAMESNTSTAEQTTDSASAAEPATTDEGETVTYQSDAGEVQVPKTPNRIVDLTSFTTGYFVALDVPVVGALSGAMGNKYIKDQLTSQGTTDLGELPTAEQLVSLKPDLIIAYTGTEGLDQLSQIAPVVQIQYGKLNYKDLMLELGKLTNREDAAKAWITNWEAQINELKPKVQAAVGDRTVSILNPYAKGLYVFGHNYGRGGEILYGEFGFKAPAKAQAEAIDSGTGFASISMEVLPEYAGDIIFTSPWSGDTSDASVVYSNTLWENLPAVKAGHVFQLDKTSDTYNDPITLEGQLKFISESLLSVK
ncbi:MULTISPECIES: ABC transporter substrate-binding protein [Paenibacillus]|uniref:ABC transporter substrate-binding protein n=1 Tax=Paenibacillus xylanilyticus TaxID=248903 RepID=A0A7Y6EUN4_9BACL|nr:ABC transporter substrate-binding protein [Paenibacillus xylanilyticus]NUU74933.1 ABC transporter substrate-binding protein [Paenibacillus xylanilyticus]